MISGINQTSSNLYTFQWTFATPSQATNSARAGGVESAASERREPSGVERRESLRSPSSTGTSPSPGTTNPVEALKTMAFNEVVSAQTQQSGLSSYNQARGLLAYGMNTG